jgi:hypothetical protein
MIALALATKDSSMARSEKHGQAPINRHYGNYKEQ